MYKIRAGRIKRWWAGRHVFRVRVFRGKDRIKIDPSKYVEKILEAFECDGLPPLKATGEQGDFILNHENRASAKITKDGK